MAPRTPLSQSVPLGELVINRLLFDRDIRDREAWITQETLGLDSTEEALEQEN